MVGEMDAGEHMAEIAKLELTKDSCADKRSVYVGKWTYSGTNSKVLSWTASDKVTIGKYCSIAQNVTFIAGGNHLHNKRMSTYPLKNNLLGTRAIESWTNGPIIIGHDVWIGYGATILSGVTIGHGAVIGAMTVVSKDIPEYAIAVGNPMRIAGYRFDKTTISNLLAIKWWDWQEDRIVRNIDKFY